MVNLAVTRRQGLVNGYIVSLLPAGAMVAAPLFGWGIRALGVRATLGGLAAVLAVTGLASAWLVPAPGSPSRGDRRGHGSGRASAGGPCSGSSRSSSSWPPPRG